MATEYLAGGDLLDAARAGRGGSEPRGDERPVPRLLLRHRPAQVAHPHLLFAAVERRRQPRESLAQPQHLVEPQPVEGARELSIAGQRRRGASHRPQQLG